MKYSCPCCGFLTFDEKPCGNFDICPVCYWEDDDIQNKNPDFVGGANGISLNQAKTAYKALGAIKKRYVEKVRLPVKDEIN